ncbi:MAG: hypothetical protein KJ667_04180, partial [Alphaproteobacteria bacterium]|nr:hypothetical protein [Alphaproteobacteria bacterium]
LAQRGWHNRSESILAGADKLRTERKALEADVTSDFEGKIKTEPLPADIKIPVALEPGREVYVVRACYLEEGIRMTTAKITDRNLWQGSSSRGDWHYIFTYNAKDERGQTLSFEYNHADASEPEIKNNIHGVRYFLNREAAEDHILELATRMSAHFSAVALDHRLRVIDRKKTNGGPAAPQP